MKTLHSLKKSSKGFTLIELLVVIGIIGLLAALVSTSTVSARQKGRDSKRLADMQNIKSALEMYHEENGRFPLSTGNNWNSSYNVSGGATWAGGTIGKWIEDTSTNPIPFTPTYIQTVPSDPINNSTYRYYYKSYGTNYKLMSRGMEGNYGQNQAKNDNGCRPSPPDCSNGSESGVDYEIFTPDAQLW